MSEPSFLCVCVGAFFLPWGEGKSVGMIVFTKKSIINVGLMSSGSHCIAPRMYCSSVNTCWCKEVVLCPMSAAASLLNYVMQICEGGVFEKKIPLVDR